MKTSCVLLLEPSAISVNTEELLDRNENEKKCHFAYKNSFLIEFTVNVVGKDS